MLKHLPATLVVCACMIRAGSVSADAASEARLREQLRQTVTQLRQLQEDNAALNAQLAAQAAQIVSPQDRAKQEAQLRESRTQAQHLSQSAATLNQDLDNSRQMLTESQAQIAARDQKLQQQAGALEASMHQRETLDLQDKSCEAKNRQFTALFDEVLQNFQQRGVVDALLAREPLTGLKRAQLERLSAGYRGKADDLRVDAAAAAAVP